MERYQLTALGYAAMGILLLFGEFLPELSAIFTPSMSFVSSLAVLVGSLGSVGMIVACVGSLLWPGERFGLGPESDHRLHLYTIWAAVLLVAFGVAV